MSEKKQIRKVVRQNWKPHIVLEVLYRIWRVVFAAAKIAVGAAATVLLIAIVAGFVFVGMLGDFLQEDILPNSALDLNDITMDRNSVIYYVDSEGQIQVQQKIDAEIEQQWVSIENIPDAMIHATIAVEDHRFYKHQGVDWITTLQACARMFFGDSSVGGSSITQQLVKNTFGSDSVTVQRKLLEIFQATQMEKRYDKNTILEYYLNVIYLGQNCSGITYIKFGVGDGGFNCLQFGRIGINNYTVSKTAANGGQNDSCSAGRLGSNGNLTVFQCKVKLCEGFIAKRLGTNRNTLVFGGGRINGVLNCVRFRCIHIQINELICSDDVDAGYGNVNKVAERLRGGKKKDHNNNRDNEQKQYQFFCH